MTTLVANTFNWIGLDGIANWFKSLSASIERNRQINHTIKELSKLSNRELNDIGISRGDIWAIAHGSTDFARNAKPKSNDNLKGWV